MSISNIDFDKIVVTRLSENTIGIDNFKNSKQDMVTHLQKDALRDQQLKIGTTWVWVYDNKVAVGYISLAMYSIDKKDILSNNDEPTKKYPYGTVPSLLVGQLATHKDYECNKIGMSMIAWAIQQALEYSKDLGCRTVALHPHEDVISWYTDKLKFKHIKRDKKQDIMYFNLLKK